MEPDNMHPFCETPEILLHYLPHRYPFLFIDKVKSVSPGDAIQVIKNITKTDCCGSRKHLFPFEYIIEVFGQAAILLFYADHTKNPEDYNTVLGSVDQFKIYGEVNVGDQLEAEVAFLKVISKAAIIRAKASVNGRMVAEAKNISAAFIQYSLRDRAKHSNRITRRYDIECM